MSVDSVGTSEEKGFVLSPFIQHVQLYIQYVVSFLMHIFFLNKILSFSCSAEVPFHYKHSFHFVSLDFIFISSFILSQLILPKVELHVCGVYLVHFCYVFVLF
ncbi:hypothetical protein LDENG_00228950 [Lucifuga dentata]|nr:hypothetical protein LDENG_00228950 [Lucifuga dentata]